MDENYPFLILILSISFKSFADNDHHTDMHDVMAHLLTPASEKIWNASGFIITKEGEFSLEPINQEEWNEVHFWCQSNNGEHFYFK